MENNKYHFAREIIFNLRSCQAISQNLYSHWIDKLIKDEKESEDVELVKYQTLIDGNLIKRLILMVNGRVIASSLLSQADKESRTIYSLYVEEDYRGQGLCRKMVDYWFGEIKKTSKAITPKVCITVHGKNSMITTYLKWGFRSNGKLDDAGNMIMTKYLS